MDGYFGFCPACHKTDGFVNASSSHLFICKEHKKYWLVGYNLFSYWKNQTEAEQRKIWQEAGLDDFENISGHVFYPPLPDGVTVVGASPYEPEPNYDQGVTRQCDRP
jgi:hypothetical protein